MARRSAEQEYARLLEDITNLLNGGQISPEILLRKIEKYQALRNERPPESASENDISERIAEFLNNLMMSRYQAGNEVIDRQNLSVQIKQVGGEKTTIRDERIKHTDSGGMHSEVEQAIVISCEGKRIEVSHAQGICEVSGKLAQKALSCRLCHRSICLRHCEFIEKDGEHYPYCNAPAPGSKTSCAKKTILSTNTWSEIEKNLKRRKH